MSSFIIIILTAFITTICVICGKSLLLKVKKTIGLEIDEISREEAALLFMERHVEFTWRPQIIDTPIATNIVNFDELKSKTKKKERKNGYGFKTNR